MLPLGSLLSENYRFLKELELTGQRITSNGISFLGVGLQDNEFLKKLSMPRNGLSSLESLSTLTLALQNNLNLEYLDLSENEIEDPAAEAIKELLRTNTSLKFVKLDKNKISSTCFAVSLCENASLIHFSINSNPLEFENCIALLEMLNINLNIQSLSMKGVKFLGSAKIKENLSGVLSKEEALILKLANVLRHSRIQSIGIDLDPKAALQLRELETSLLKHNSTLTSISSDNINWKVPLQGPLLGIQKALKANLLLARTDSFEDEELTCELESIVEAKRYQNNKESKTLKHFHQAPELDLRRFSTESPNFSSPGTSPDFLSVSPHLSEIRGKESRIAKFDQNKQKNFNRVAEELNLKMQGFQEEIIMQVNLLQDRVQELENTLKKSNNENWAAKIQELEKRDEATQSLLMLLTRELAEIKAQGVKAPDANSQYLMKIQGLEKKIQENSYSARKMQKQLEDVELKVLRIQSFEGSEYSESKKNSEKNSVKGSGEEASEARKIEVNGLPGVAEQLVMKAIQERCYWSAKKKGAGSRGNSPGSPAVNNFYSPEDCPSKDLHDRLVKKGLNFMPRSVSSYKRQGLS